MERIRATFTLRSKPARGISGNCWVVSGNFVRSACSSQAFAGPLLGLIRRRQIGYQHVSAPGNAAHPVVIRVAKHAPNV